MPQNRQELRCNKAREIYGIAQLINIYEAEIISTKKRFPQSKEAPRYISLLEGYIDELRSTESRMNAYIAGIEDERIRQVVKYRVVDGMTVEEIADIMNYSDRMIKRLWASRP